MVLSQYGVEGGTGAGHWVRRRQYWLFQGCTRSVRGGTGLFLVILGQYKAALDGALW